MHHRQYRAVADQKNFIQRNLEEKQSRTPSHENSSVRRHGSIRKKGLDERVATSLMKADVQTRASHTERLSSRLQQSENIAESTEDASVSEGPSASFKTKRPV